ncbi:FKBP-type peptidyl-prolyl cis-trans isomerase [Nonomuraea sp. NPDC005650]|uniref:FKBP-type peptidyl-prolyl cis-trans isomerase n=1 Tax=Nonomuraea sp. NPDC005650 TaxID=3157045 RepID=UPI00339F43FD
MRRRRTAAILPVLLLLAGCAGGVARDLGMTVGGPFGARPTIAFAGGGPAAGLRVEELESGAGAPLGADDLAIVQYTAHVWDGRDNRVVDSTFDRGTPAAFALGELPPGLDGALRGRRVGSRVVAAVPPQYRGGAQPPPGVGPGDELVYVVDIIAAHPKGASVEAGGGSLAGVRVTAGAPPALEVPATAPPPAFEARVLVRGEGRGTRAGQLVVAQYEGAVWGSRRVFEATWTSGRPKAFKVGDGGVLKGWERALVGVPAGSRVLMVVPPSYGYGPAGDPAHGITGTDTLVYVVDLIAAY